MPKYKKYPLIVLSLIMCLFMLVGCGKMTIEQYNQLENNFYSIYDPIVKDFYNEALQGANGQLISDKLYHNHDDDIDKLSKIIYNVKENQIPSEKKDNFKKMNDEFLNIFFLSGNSVQCEVPSNLDEKHKQDLIDNCKKFISFNKDRIEKLGVNQETQTSNNNVKSDLELLDKITKSENGIIYVTGTIKNNTNKTYSYVSVKINLYDKDDNQVGNTLDSITNLEAGGIWKFKCSTSVDFDKYKIVSINGN